MTLCRTLREVLPPWYPSCAFKNPRARPSSSVCPEHLAHPPWSTVLLYACDSVLQLSSSLLPLFLFLYPSTAWLFFPRQRWKLMTLHTSCVLHSGSSNHSTAQLNISHSYLVPVSCVGSGACLFLSRDLRSKMGRGEEGH